VRVTSTLLTIRSSLPGASESSVPDRIAKNIARPDERRGARHLPLHRLDSQVVAFARAQHEAVWAEAHFAGVGVTDFVNAAKFQADFCLSQPVARSIGRP
jgi:hypothetical protein